ncbi:MAG TPA: penicillin-binding protein activator, partial [Candidatus Kryptonia bacterium]|nr:penicillin-binding protein activator [Candidatus Kryptonia bacterium]
GLEWLIALASLCTLLAVACTTEPSPPAPAPPAFVRAEDTFQRGEYAHAIEAYRAFLKDPTDDTYVPRAWYKLALCHYRLRDYRAALAALDELANEFPRQTWPQSAALRGDVHQALGNNVSALEAWAEAWHVGDANDRAALRPRVDRLVERLSDAERERALEVVSEPAIRTAIQRPPVATRAIPAVTTGATMVATPNAVPPAARTPLAPAARVGCLLPLSGPHRMLGERSLQGLRLAFGDDGDRLIVKDTRSSPEVARAAFEELAARGDTVAVIGPLRSNEAAMVAPLAESAQLPLLLLAQREGLTNRLVFQPAMTRGHQAAALAAYALRAHWRQFGILAPSDKYGREFTDRFRTAVETRGGRVAWNDSYDPRTHEVTSAIGHAREHRNRGGLDAVFIPDNASAAIAVGGKLREVMPDIGLLGPNDWNNPTALAGAALDGAVLVAGFYPDSNRPATRAFVEAFRKAHDATPDIFAAQAYDAGALARDALRRDATTRATMADALHHVASVAGATGILRVTDLGVERELFLLRIVGGRLEEVEPSER